MIFAVCGTPWFLTDRYWDQKMQVWRRCVGRVLGGGAATLFLINQYREQMMYTWPYRRIASWMPGLLGSRGTVKVKVD
jgi:hypothetical protein